MYLQEIEPFYPQQLHLESAIIGCLLGTAIGDALGLPYEGLSRRRGALIFPDTHQYHFLGRKGMISDDTEHTTMVAQALIISRGEPVQFLDSFAHQLRFWLLALPAGMGMATLKASLKLLCGYLPDKSGVYSAGNGPAMRSAILGVCYGDKIPLLLDFISKSTRITHRDPKAEYGALAVALAAFHSANAEVVEPQKYLQMLENHLPQNPVAKELLGLVNKAWDSYQKSETTEAFAVTLGLAKGISGYVYHTVPVVLHAWFSYPNDFQKAVETLIRCGGDTDTTGAIVGGIIGARVKEEGLPQSMISNLMEWPRSISWLKQLGKKLAVVMDGYIEYPMPLSFYATLLRNLFFIPIVLFHGFRRLLPPY